MTTDKAGGAESAPNDGEQSNTDNLSAAMQRADMIEDVLESDFDDKLANASALDMLDSLKDDLEAEMNETSVEPVDDRFRLSEADRERFENGMLESIELRAQMPTLVRRLIDTLLEEADDLDHARELAGLEESDAR